MVSSPLFIFQEEGKAIDVAADALDKCVAKRPPVVMLLLLNIFRLRFSIFYIFPLFFLSFHLHHLSYSYTSLWGCNTGGA
jgi:hypothetical protein